MTAAERDGREGSQAWKWKGREGGEGARDGSGERRRHSRGEGRWRWHGARVWLSVGRGGSDSRVSLLVYIFDMIVGSSGPRGLGLIY